MTITVHHLNNSRSQRILWLLEELECEYDIAAYQRDDTTNLAPPELAQATPLGKSPVIEDDRRIVTESGAIIQYLCERRGGENWLPDPDSDDYIAYLEWMQFGESSFFVPVMMKILVGRLGEAAAPALPRIEAQLSAHVAYMAGKLGDRDHFVSNSWTAADIMMSFPAEIAVMQGYGKAHPNLTDYVGRVHERPAWQRARERGGPYFGW